MAKKIFGSFSVIKDLTSTKADVDNIQIDGNAITSTNSNGDITITPNGTGRVKPHNAYAFAATDGTVNQFQLTNGSGVLSWSDYGIASQNFSGFKAWTGSGNYYSVSGTNFTLLRGGSGFIKNVAVTWAGSQTVSSLSAGSCHFIYVDSTGTIGSTTTRNLALFTDNIVLFEALVDSAGTANVIVVCENHPFSFPSAVSEWAHDVIGPVIENTNNGANIVLNGTKGIQINGEDYLEDHGLDTTIPDSAGAAVTFSFMYTNAAGKWVRNSTGTTFASSYNSAGTITALTAGKFGVYRLYVSKSDLNNSTPTYYAVYHTAQFDTQGQATTAISNGTIAQATAEFYKLEVAQLGYIVKRQSTDAITSVIISKSTAKTTTSTTGTNNAALVLTNTTAFDGWLSSADTSVQASLDTLDDKFTNTNARIFTLQGIASGYTSSSNIQKQASVQTTNNSATDLVQVVMAAGQMLTLEARVNGFKSDYSSCIGARIFATFRRSTAGNVTVVGTSIIDICEDPAGTDVTVIADTANQEATIQITGIAGETWNWVCTYQYHLTLSNT